MFKIKPDSAIDRLAFLLCGALFLTVATACLILAQLGSFIIRHVPIASFGQSIGMVIGTAVIALLFVRASPLWEHIRSVTAIIEAIGKGFGGERSALSNGLIVFWMMLSYFFPGSGRLPGASLFNSLLLSYHHMQRALDAGPELARMTSRQAQIVYLRQHPEFLRASTIWQLRLRRLFHADPLQREALREYVKVLSYCRRYGVEDGLIELAGELGKIPRPFRRLYEHYIDTRRPYYTESDATGLDQAITTLEQMISSQHFASAPYPFRIDILTEVGAMSLKRFEARGTIGDLDRALYLGRRLRDSVATRHPQRHRVLQLLGSALKHNYNLRAVRQDLNEAMACDAELSDRVALGKGNAGDLSNIGVALRNRYYQGNVLDDLTTAIDFHERAVATAAKAQGPGYESDSRDLHALCLTNLAHVLHDRYRLNQQQADLARTVALLQDAVRLTPEGHPEHVTRVAQLGFVMTECEAPDQIEQGLTIIRSALARIPDTHPDNPTLTHLYIMSSLRSMPGRLAEIRRTTQGPNNSASRHVDPLALYREFISLTQLLHQLLKRWSVSHYPDKFYGAAIQLGVLLFAGERYEEARPVLEMAHQANRYLLRDGASQVEKRVAAETDADLYERLVHCCVQMGDTAAAFTYAAVAKGRSLVDRLGQESVNIERYVSTNTAFAADLQQIRTLQQQIDLHETAVEGYLGSSALNQELVELRRKLDAAWKAFELDHPESNTIAQMPLLDAVQACALAEALDATLVEYYREQTASGVRWCAFVVTAVQIRYVSLPGLNADLLVQLARYRARITNPRARRLTHPAPAMATFLQRWCDAVFVPIAWHLKPGGRVVIAPYGELHHFPIQAASYAVGTEQRYIADAYEFAVSPSISALWASEQRRMRQATPPATPRDTALIIACDRAHDDATVWTRMQMSAETVAAGFRQAKRLYRSAATREAIAQSTKEQSYHAVHFICHGALDEAIGLPDQAKLRLANGALDVRQIISEVDFSGTCCVTLAACSSALAHISSSDELSSITTAFQVAGAAAVVSALWDVDVAATLQFFEYFYAYLHHGQSPAGAVRAAARQIRSQPGWESPYYWASFQAHGQAFAGLMTREVGQVA